MIVRASALGLCMLAACSTLPPGDSGDGIDEDVEVLGKKPPKPGSGGSKADAGVDSAPSPDAAIDAGTPVDAAPPPPPEWTDACTLPGAVVATFKPYGSIGADDEGATAALPLPFAFSYFGKTQSQYWLTSNGELGFGSSPGGMPFGQVRCPLPDAQVTKPIVFAYGVDLMGGTVCTAVTGTSPLRKLVITWKDKRFYELDGSGNGTSNVAFGATLSEGTNAIELAVHKVTATSPFYSTIEIAKGSLAVLGLQQGSSALSFSCHETKAPAGTKFLYRP